MPWSFRCCTTAWPNSTSSAPYAPLFAVVLVSSCSLSEIKLVVYQHWRVLCGVKSFVHCCATAAAQQRPDHPRRCARTNHPTLPSGPSLDLCLVLDGDARTHISSLARARDCDKLTNTSIIAMANKYPNLTKLKVRVRRVWHILSHVATQLNAVVVSSCLLVAV